MGLKRGEGIAQLLKIVEELKDGQISIIEDVAFQLAKSYYHIESRDTHILLGDKPIQ